VKELSHDHKGQGAAGLETGPKYTGMPSRLPGWLLAAITAAAGVAAALACYESRGSFLLWLLLAALWFAALCSVAAFVLFRVARRAPARSIAPWAAAALVVLAAPFVITAVQRPLVDAGILPTASNREHLDAMEAKAVAEAYVDGEVRTAIYLAEPPLRNRIPSPDDGRWNIGWAQAVRLGPLPKAYAGRYSDGGVYEVAGEQEGFGNNWRTEIVLGRTASGRWRVLEVTATQ